VGVSSRVVVVIFHNDTFGAPNEGRLRIQDDGELAAFTVQLQEVAAVDLVSLKQARERDHAYGFTMVRSAARGKRKRHRVAAHIERSLAILRGAGQVQWNNVFY